VLVCLGAGCLETPGTAGDAGVPPDGGGPPGTVAWQIPLGVSLPLVAIDHGDLTVAASLEGTAPLDPPVTATGGGSDLLIAGFTAGGEQRFAKVHGGAADEIPRAISVSSLSDQAGVFGVYQAGEANLGGENMPAPVAETNMFVARYAANGGHLWSLSGTADGGASAGYALSMSGTGAMAMSGDYGSELQLGDVTAAHPGAASDLYFARVQSGGDVDPLVGYGGEADQIGAGALFDGLGQLYLFGTQTGPFIIGAFSPDADSDGALFVCRIDEQGTTVSWLFDSLGGRVGGLRGAVAPDGSLLLTGWFDLTFAFDLPEAEMVTSGGGTDAFIARIEPDGDVGWLARFGGAGDDEPLGIAVGPDGTIAVTGSFRGEATLNDAEATLTSKGGTDIFLLVLAADHSLVRASSFGNVEDDAGLSVAVDDGGAVVLAASYRGEVDFGGSQPLATAGDSEGALIRFY